MKNFNYRYSSPIIISLIISMILALPVKSQTNANGSAPQFLYPDFTKSKVRMKNGQIQYVILNYNTVSEKMVFQKDDKLYDMVNPQMIDTVFLQNSLFVPAGKVFYEILLAAPASFFVQYKGELLLAGTPAGYGVPSQVSNTKNLSSIGTSTGNYNIPLPSDYTVKTELVYWIKRDDGMFSFINEKQFLKLFPEKEKDLKQFIKQNKIKFDRIPDVVRLAEYFNKLIL